MSGGVDSTYVAYKIVREYQLRPLAVHFDNGWDSELAVNNIENVVKRLGIDLYTWVVDWEEFKDLQLSYLKAGVPNLEIPSDAGIWSALYHVANRIGVRYIISGHNAATEGILPRNWNYTARDSKQLMAIHRRFGSKSMSSYPKTSLYHYPYYIFVKRINKIILLNYLDYVKEDAIQTITREFDWRNYGGKHYESIYTRFFQGCILPERFGYDKRKAHLSTLICSGQITRQEALKQLASNEYLDGPQSAEDREFVIKKLRLTEDEFVRLMTLPKKTHRDYPSNRWFFENLSIITRIFNRLGIRYK